MTSLRALLRDPHFRRGARDMLDFAPGIAAWGLVTGVAMAKSGLSSPIACSLARWPATPPWPSRTPNSTPATNNWYDGDRDGILDGGNLSFASYGSMEDRKSVV